MKRPALRAAKPLHIKAKPLRDWTLRTQIVTGVLTLFVVLSVSIGIFTEIALKRSLTNRLDSDLMKAANRPSQSNGFGNRFDQAGALTEEQKLRALVNGPTTANQVGAFYNSVEATAAIVRDGPSTGFFGPPPVALGAGVIAALRQVSADGHVHTVSLPGLGSYRVVARSGIIPGPSATSGTYVAGLPTKSINDTVTKLLLVILGLTAAGLVIAGFLCTLLVKLALKPLHRVTATASRVAEMPLDEGEVALAVRVRDPNPNTEVGQVGVALNRMLENVSDALNARHQSETRVRQFVADASHELRTPLAAIRGYAELTRRSRDAAPPDIAHAMGRVESEATRMTTLVEDLLLLARLDEGRPLDSVEVDLTSLTFDVLSDARAAGRQHLWHLDVPDEPVVTIGDPARLHQVLANLLANARTHTPPGTVIEISLQEKAKDVILVVRDDGPGIPPHQIGEIFERFARGEASRSRTAGSTGLGLAIVAAVVSAHSGTIAVTSRPGATVFTVTLPKHGDRQAVAQTAASFSGQSH